MNLDLMRKSITADPLGRYYTSDWIGSALVNSINLDNPSLIVELGVGEGALSNAAATKWSSCQFVTVDIDKSSGFRLSNESRIIKHRHHVHDVLDDNLSEFIGVPLSTADVAVCNPPYIRPRWRGSFSKILKESGFVKALNSVYDAGSDLLFLAQNLRLLKEHGKLGLILPDGLITGEKFFGIRQVLLNEHLVEEVIQLPRDVFSRTEAQTYLMILTKNDGPTSSIKLSSISKNGIISTPINIKATNGFLRLDYKFHSMLGKSMGFSAKSNPLNISTFTDSLNRGNINSNQIAQYKFPVFHTTDLPAIDERKIISIPKSLRVPRRNLKPLPVSVKYAQAGDVLIARVGRNLQERVCLIESGNCIVSDCIFVLRPIKGYSRPIFDFLTSNKGKELLLASTHGVGATYLCRSDILNIPFSFFKDYL